MPIFTFLLLAGVIIVAAVLFSRHGRIKLSDSGTSKSRGPWVHRFAVYLLTIILAVLFFWLLGFFVEDIRSIKGPDYEAIKQKYIDKALLDKSAGLDQQINDLSEQIGSLNRQQQVLVDSTLNLQQTINQLLELRKIGMEKNITFSDTEQVSLTNSLNLFLENQKKYQDLTQTVSDLTSRQEQLRQEKNQILKEIENQREPAHAEYVRLVGKHNIKLASLQLAILIPILIIAAALIIRKRGSIYFPMLLAIGAATLLKVILVIHEYFPSEHFKYILLLAALYVVSHLLVYFIRAIAFPKLQWLLGQYREAYEGFLCPICDYPIRTGPRKYLFWTRRTVNRTVVSGGHGEEEEPYICPACGSALFEECESCHKIRHSLLPHCAHCGAEKPIV